MRRSSLLALLAACVMGAPVAEAAPNPDRLARQIVSAPDLKGAVAATQKALVAGGVGVVVNGRVVQRARRPAPIAVSGTEVLNLAFEARQKETAGGMTLAELAGMLRRARFPIRRPRRAAASMRAFLRVWVRGAQRTRRDARSFNARFLAAMAKRQGRSVNLAKGDYAPGQLWLTRLEVELFVAAFQRGPKRLWGGSGSARRSAVVAQETSPCSDYRKFQKQQLEELFGKAKANDYDAILDHGFKMLGGAISGPALDKGLSAAIEQWIVIDKAGRPGQRAKKLAAKRASQAMAALNLLLKIQKLATMYGSVGIQVIPEQDRVHKPYRNKEKRAFAALAGIDQEERDEYEALQKQRAESDLTKALKDCLKLLDLPSITDTGDVAEEMEKWRVRWSFSMLNSHAEINVKDTKYDAGLFKQKLQRINAYEAGAGPVYVNIKPEDDRDHAGCRPPTKEAYVSATADLDMSKPPGLGTVIDVVSGNVPAVVLEAAEQMFLQLVKPSGTGTMTVTYHVPDKATASVAQVCHGFAPAWNATANGTATFDGITETFGGSYRLERQTEDDESALYFVKSGSLQWQISGTDSQGCSYSGSGTLEVGGNLALYPTEPLEEYTHQLTTTTQSVPVTVQCPNRDSEVRPVQPMNYDVSARGPYRWENNISGNRSYSWPDESGAAISWSWQLQGTS